MSSKDNSNQITILRIKRKRTEEPLDALRKTTRITRKSDIYLIFILVVHQENEKKLKKNTESENKSVLTGKSRLFTSQVSHIVLVSATALPTLFRLAETVEQKSFSNLDEAKKLKDRISRRIQPGTSRPQTPTSLEDRRDRLVKEQKEAANKARYRVIHQNRTTVSENAPPV